MGLDGKQCLIRAGRTGIVLAVWYSMTSVKKRQQSGTAECVGVMDIWKMCLIKIAHTVGEPGRKYD